MNLNQQQNFLYYFVYSFLVFTSWCCVNEERNHIARNHEEANYDDRLDSDLPSVLNARRLSFIAGRWIFDDSTWITIIVWPPTPRHTGHCSSLIIWRRRRRGGHFQATQWKPGEKKSLTLKAATKAAFGGKFTMNIRRKGWKAITFCSDVWQPNTILHSGTFNVLEYLLNLIPKSWPVQSPIRT